MPDTPAQAAKTHTFTATPELWWLNPEHEKQLGTLLQSNQPFTAEITLHGTHTQKPSTRLERHPHGLIATTTIPTAPTEQLLVQALEVAFLTLAGHTAPLQDQPPHQREATLGHLFHTPQHPLQALACARELEQHLQGHFMHAHQEISPDGIPGETLTGTQQYMHPTPTITQALTVIRMAHENARALLKFLLSDLANEAVRHVQNHPHAQLKRDHHA